MQIGMIGTGRMGANMVRRLKRAGHECIVNARHIESIQPLLDEGIVGTTSLPEFVAKLSRPRLVWMMIPAASVDTTLSTLAPLLDRDDIVVDGGNSYYHDDIRRAKQLTPLGIHYVDCGVSGGVWGLERGFCLMIGGETEVVQHLDPIVATLAPGVSATGRTASREGPPGPAEQGYLHCGPSGAGHFVKMVHNGIEYGIMAAFAEGLNVLKHANIGTHQGEVDAETAPLSDPAYYQYDFNLPDVAELWRHGSVIGSWLLDLTAHALLQNPNLSTFEGRVSDSGEGRWTLAVAIDEGVPVPVLSAALFERFSSRGNDEFANRILSAMRFEFGGHLEKTEPPSFANEHGGV